ncbi:MAG: exonuclease domain-containing protein, partial [Desulfocucumaceae bacterium]
MKRRGGNSGSSKEYNLVVEDKAGVDLLLDHYVALDLETTGLNPGRDSIIEVGMVKVRGGLVVESFHSMVRPDKKLPLRIKKLTGIDDGMLEGAPPAHQVKEALWAFLDGENIVGHGIEFDISFIESLLGRKIKNSRYDTLELARIMYPSASSYRLGDLCSAFGHGLAAHRAMEDARAVVLLCENLTKSLAQLDGQVAASLTLILNRAGSAWGEVISRQPLREQEVLSLYENRYTEKKNYYCEENIDYAVRKESNGGFIDTGEVKKLLSEDGVLAGQMAFYEWRSGQVEMALEVASAFNEDKFLLVEAGTGTGKSIAYLVPAILWAASGGPRVVISTKTINLQDQLWYKDLPQVTKSLGISIRTALAKGRSNYICLRRWNAALSEGKWSAQEAAFFARVLVWVNKTQNGDKIELNINQHEEEIWLNICADSENCLGSRCRYYSGGCFIVRARREAEASSIIVTNHALLFSDIKTGNMVLPAYGPLIIDEAHHLEDAATDQLGKQVSRSDIRRWLNGSARIVLKCWEIVPPSDQSAWLDGLVAIRETINRLRSVSDEFFAAARNYFIPDKGAGEGDQQSFRIKSEYIRGDGRGLPWAELSNLVFAVKTLNKGFKKISDLMQVWVVDNESWVEKLKDFMHLASNGAEILDTL